MILPQKQNGGSDCGMFAIAFATSIAIHQNVDVKFDQARMRAYLANCIEKGSCHCFLQSYCLCLYTVPSPYVSLNI